jgi:xylulokinase
MSLLGVDVGTTAAKAVAFAANGTILATASEEYDISRPKAGHAELDAVAIWPRIRAVIASAARAAAAAGDPVESLAVDSMGENLVPVTRDRRIAGPSIMNMDVRGQEFLPALAGALSPEALYRITGNTLSNQFSIVKLMWTRKYQPALYESVDYFMPWNSFVAFMLGAEPTAEFALANRTLLFDVDGERWSERMLKASGLDGAKLPPPVAAGTRIGEVSAVVAEETGIAAGTPIIAGTHDQCSASLGSGALGDGVAMYGMGTFHCIAPVFRGRKPAAGMVERGLNTEHYAVPGTYLSLVYNSGGSVVKWYRDTFAGREHALASARGEDVYPALFAEAGEKRGEVLVIPHFAAMGPPDFVDPPYAAIVGMDLGTGRGEVLRGILEGNIYSLKITIDALDQVDISIDQFRTTGGGSKSDLTLQLVADIMGRPCVRPEVTEASALGCALLAGVGSGVFGDLDEGMQQMIRLGATFEPDMARHKEYAEPFERWKRLREFVVGFTPE